MKTINHLIIKNKIKSGIGFLMIIILSLSTSCEKYLEVEPTNVLAIKTYDDVKALMGSYLKGFVTMNHTLAGTTIPYKNNTAKMVFQFYSDDLDYERYLTNPFGRNNRAIFNNSLNWQEPTSPGIIWKEYYKNIGFFNTILTELGRLKNISQDEYNLIAGEAKVLRARYLFKLMQYFAPYQVAELGLPINLDAEAVGNYESNRKTQAETYNIIIAELNEVLNYSTAPKDSYSIYYDKKIINAILAQVYHYKGGSAAGVSGDYDLAIAHAKKAMEGRQLETLDNYDPMSSSSGTGFYKDQPFALMVHVYSTPSKGLQSIIGIPMYGASTIMYSTQQLYELYDEKDIRKTYFFNDKKGITKFEHPDSYGLDMNFIFRIAELHLIIAESYARKGDATEAKSWYENFMKTRVQDYQYKGEDVLSAIMTERRKEFCFEDDMRWLDLTRTQKGWQRKALDKNDNSMYTLADGDHRFCFPIPLEEELQYNKIQQNPGWGNL
ncbi:RagB/SusD family nutrient uptake outer membrane protein [Sphingobacterium luzhongxinii]|uniref:RagB/SusD family nutrient uptake outer membrane protein n=1 Tax=Sphingobacterium luzhongxinii TaxID=2654181 RepID=UPI0013DC2F62|nr:RagB/SusD family nutrient uptake outer membrane protein [Sphingobacterium sp. xlx-73]